jgi:NAD(P)-dependent dehydrogenase (short-subunit alcohol dehydrogenase family)
VLAPRAVANIAGVGHVGTILGTTEADFDRVTAVNMKGIFFVSKAAVRRAPCEPGPACIY